jgi:competence protein ComEC
MSQGRVDPLRADHARPDPSFGVAVRQSASRPDVRLAGPAVCAWAGAFLATSGQPAGLALLAVCGLLAAAVVVAARRGGWAAAACVLGLVAGLGMGGLRWAGLRVDQVDQLARAGAAARVMLVVTGDPAPHAGRTQGSQRRGADLIAVPARMVTLTAGGRLVRMRVPVLVLAVQPDSLDRWRRLLPGQRLAARVVLRPAEPGEPLAAVALARSPPYLLGRPPLVQRAAGHLRAGLRQAVVSLPAGPRGLLPGLVVGDTSRMPPQLVDDFRTAGLTHLVAVSGANVAIVVGFVLLVARWLGTRGRWLPLLGALATAGFVVLARPQPSVLRAAVMGGVALLALATGRRRTSLAALAAAVLLLVLVDPWLARSYGFVLSTLATAALIVLAPGWTTALRDRGLPTAIAAAVAVPLAAQAVCGPVVAMIAGQVSLVAVLANLLAAPAVAPATVLGVLATVVSVVSSRLASLIADAAALPAWWIVTVAERSATAPMASIGWSTSVESAVVLAVLTVALSAAVRRLSRRPRLALACVVLVVVGLVVTASSPGWPPRGWLLVACDVGQGDGLVLSAGAAGAVVVDAGPDPRLMDRCLRRLRVHAIAVVVLSHFHADHVEGLPGVLHGRRVGEIVVSPYGEPAAERDRVLAWASAAHVPVRVVTVRERVTVGPLAWRVLWPRRVIEGEGSAPNNASIVMLVDTEGVRLLLCGDVEPPAQRALLSTWAAGPVDVLKVAHHGSAYQAPELLAAVRPRVAVISVGAQNDYGHPARRTLRALARIGAVVRRTDRDGTVAVVGPAARLRVVGGPG